MPTLQDARAIDAASPPQPAGLLRRLAALVYDGLLLVALLMIVTAGFLPLTGGEAIRWTTSPTLFVLHKLVVAGIVVIFYGLFWTRQGHTLGMATWRLRVQRTDGARLSWPDTVRRLAAAVLSWLPAGLGWLWCVFDREHRTWHDVLSHTRVVVVPKMRRTKPSAR